MTPKGFWLPEGSISGVWTWLVLAGRGVDAGGCGGGSVPAQEAASEPRTDRIAIRRMLGLISAYHTPRPHGGPPDRGDGPKEGRRQARPAEARREEAHLPDRQAHEDQHANAGVAAMGKCLTSRWPPRYAGRLDGRTPWPATSAA